MRGLSCPGVGLEKSRFLYCRWRVGVLGTGEKELKPGLSGDDGGGLDAFEKRGGEDEVASMKLIVGQVLRQLVLVMVVVIVGPKGWAPIASVAKIEMHHVMWRNGCPVTGGQ